MIDTLAPFPPTPGVPLSCKRRSGAVVGEGLRDIVGQASSLRYYGVVGTSRGLGIGSGQRLYVANKVIGIDSESRNSEFGE